MRLRVGAGLYSWHDSHVLTTSPYRRYMSSGILSAPTFGGIVFDPDSSTFDSFGIYSPNDTTGDEFYTYQWFSSSNL